MRLTWSRWVLPGILAIAAVGIATYSAHAGCCGGGGFSVGNRGGYTVAAGYGRAYSCCGSCGMAMGGMSMADAPAQSPAPVHAPATPMNMAPNAPAPTPAASAAITPRPLAGGSFTCAMHPSVASNGPGSCPYCGMALTKRP